MVSVVFLLDVEVESHQDFEKAVKVIREFVEMYPGVDAKSLHAAMGNVREAILDQLEK